MYVQIYMDVLFIRATEAQGDLHINDHADFMQMQKQIFSAYVVHTVYIYTCGRSAGWKRMASSEMEKA